MTDLTQLTYNVIDEFLKADIAIAADERIYLNQRGYEQVTLNEFRLLGLIERTPKPTMTVLAKTLGITMGTLTSIVSRLERKGYLLRERQSFDKRVIYVKLQTSGVEAAQAYTEFFRERIKAAQPYFDEAEIAVILKYFRYQYEKANNSL
ncbi:MAG: MarR family winged helix-turn-helix transcriptional regulator [Culicoidibacterales bacterium]